jgi:hypothetical protein
MQFDLLVSLPDILTLSLCQSIYYLHLCCYFVLHFIQQARPDCSVFTSRLTLLTANRSSTFFFNAFVIELDKYQQNIPADDYHSISIRPGFLGLSQWHNLNKCPTAVGIKNLLFPE